MKSYSTNLWTVVCSNKNSLSHAGPTTVHILLGSCCIQNVKAEHILFWSNTGETKDNKILWVVFVVICYLNLRQTIKLSVFKSQFHQKAVKDCIQFLNIFTMFVDLSFFVIYNFLSLAKRFFFLILQLLKMFCSFR